jgi:tripartite-type tricarboxylate transporter receptor subunit TctC
MSKKQKCKREEMAARMAGTIGAVAGILLGVMIGNRPSWAAEPANAEFCTNTYQGKNIVVISTFTPGGGDLVARLHADMLTKYLPGHPATRVENVPGGSDGVGSAYFARHANRDGLSVLFANSNALRTFVKAGKSAGYDPREFRAIGSLAMGHTIVVVRPNMIANTLDHSKTAAAVGDTTGVRTQVPLTLIASDYLGQNYRWVFGYPGGAELVLALQRGEIDVYGSINRGDLHRLIDAKDAVPVFQDGETRDRDFPDTPTLTELLKQAGKQLTPEDDAAYKNWLAPNQATYLFMAQAGTPDAIIACLRDAHQAMTMDPEFKSRMAATLGDVWQLVPGDRTEEIIKDATTVSDATARRLQEIRKAHGLPAE